MSSETPTLRLLLLLPLPLLAACEAVSPTPVGSISGQVVIEGQGVGGVAVTLSSGASTTTAATGTYRFDQVEGGPHTVAISGYPLDATFQATSASVEIVSDGQTVIVDFRGEYIRTARLMGRVAVEGRTLAGVTVRLAGMSEGLTSTNDVGQFSFEDLRAGDYSVAISDFGEVQFAVTSQSASLAVGESRVLSFDGTYIRTSSISVGVSVEGEGLAGVTVSLTGHGEVASAVTGPAGHHTFNELRKGTYFLEISGFDTAEVAFSATTRTVSVAVDETENVAFDGQYLRTASIIGAVTVENKALPGVNVRLSGGLDAVSEMATTDANGHYAFTGLRMGDYTVEVSGFDSDEVGFSSTATAVSVGTGESKIVSFDGTFLRTSGIQGRVTIEGEGLAGVTVSLSGGPDAVSETATTDAGGQYAFLRLRAGDYSVAISGYDTDEYNFEITSQDVPVAPGETATVAFEGFRVPPDLTGTHDLVSISSLVTGGKTLKPPDVSGTFVLRQSAAVGRRASGTMTTEITVRDGLGGTTTIKDTGTYAVEGDGTWEQKGSLVQAKGTYTLVGGVLTVEVTEPAINVSTTVWQRR